MALYVGIGVREGVNRSCGDTVLSRSDVMYVRVVDRHAKEAEKHTKSLLARNFARAGERLDEQSVAVIKMPRKLIVSRLVVSTLVRAYLAGQDAGHEAGFNAGQDMGEKGRLK